MSETKIREEICRLGRSLFERGLTPGSSGNISVGLDDGGWLVTPTNASLGSLDPARLSRLGPDGSLLSGDAPTKEVPLHTALYQTRQTARAVVNCRVLPGEPIDGQDQIAEEIAILGGHGTPVTEECPFVLLAPSDGPGLGHILAVFAHASAGGAILNLGDVQPDVRGLQSETNPQSPAQFARLTHAAKPV